MRQQGKHVEKIMPPKATAQGGGAVAGGGGREGKTVRQELQQIRGGKQAFDAMMEKSIQQLRHIMDIMGIGKKLHGEDRVEKSVLPSILHFLTKGHKIIKKHLDETDNDVLKRQYNPKKGETRPFLHQQTVNNYTDTRGPEYALNKETFVTNLLIAVRNIQILYDYVTTELENIMDDKLMDLLCASNGCLDAMINSIADVVQEHKKIKSPFVQLQKYIQQKQISIQTINVRQLSKEHLKKFQQIYGKLKQLGRTYVPQKIKVDGSFDEFLKSIIEHFKYVESLYPHEAKAQGGAATAEGALGYRMVQLVKRKIREGDLDWAMDVVVDFFEFPEEQRPKFLSILGIKYLQQGNLEQAHRIVNLPEFPKGERINFLHSLGMKYLQKGILDKAVQISETKDMHQHQAYRQALLENIRAAKAQGGAAKAQGGAVRGKQIILFLQSTYDPQHAYDRGDEGFFALIKKDFGKLFTLQHARVSSLREIHECLERIRDKKQQIAYLVVMAHGTKNEIQLSEKEFISIGKPEFQVFVKDIRRVLQPGASILLHGCNLGEGGRGQNNFAQQLSLELPGHKIYAAETEIRRDELQVNRFQLDQNDIIHSQFKLPSPNKMYVFLTEQGSGTKVAVHTQQQHQQQQVSSQDDLFESAMQANLHGNPEQLQKIINLPGFPVEHRLKFLYLLGTKYLEKGNIEKAQQIYQMKQMGKQQKEILRKEIQRKRYIKYIKGAVAGGGVAVHQQHHQQQQVDSQDDLHNRARIALTLPPINLQQALKIINLKGFPERHRSSILLLLGIKYLEKGNIEKAQQIYQMKQMGKQQKEELHKVIQRKRIIYGAVAGGGGSGSGVGNGKKSKKGT